MTTPDKKPSSIITDPHIRKVILTIGYMLIIAGFAAATKLLWPFFDRVFSILAPFIAALVVAYLLNPAVTYFQTKLKIARWLAVTVVYFLITLVVGVFIAICAPILAKQIGNAYDGIHDVIVERALPWIDEHIADLDGQETSEVQTEEISARINSWLTARNLTAQDIIDNTLGNQSVRQAATDGAGFFGKIMAFIGGVIGQIFSFGMFLVFAALVCFYFLIDFGSFRGIMEVLTPDHFEDRMFGILERIDVAVGGFIRGQLICALLVGIETFLLLFFVLGIKEYALLIALIAGFANVIPYLGPALGATPAVLYMFFSGDHATFNEQLLWAGITVASFGVIQFLDGFVLQPKIVGEAASLHPVAMIVALAFGAQWGILGMLIAVPVACAIRVMLKEFFWDKREEEWHRTTGKKKLSDFTPSQKVVETDVSEETSSEESAKNEAAESQADQSQADEEDEEEK